MMNFIKNSKKILKNLKTRKYRYLLIKTIMPAKSKAQQKFMGMVHSAQKGEMKPKGAVAKAAKSMTNKSATDFASTKHKGLPEKLKENKTPGEPITFSHVLRPKTHTEKLSEILYTTNILEFAKDYSEGKFQNELGPAGKIHGYYNDHEDAQNIANTLINELFESAKSLEEKKSQVTDALQKKIDELQKKAEDHLKLAKKEPENAEKHQDEAEKMLARIKVLREKHKVVEGSKRDIKPLEENK